MSEVLIVLKLRRRSGVLAAAVAAVHRAGLEFQSQRMVDEDGTILLHIQAEGGLESIDPVVETMAAVSGVSDVVDILADGVSQVFPPQEPELETEVESAEAVDSGLFAQQPWSEPERQPAAFESEPLNEVGNVSEPDSQLLPEPEPEAVHELEPDQVQAHAQPQAQQSASCEQSSGPASESQDTDPDGPRMMTPAMRRRRRRLR